MTVLFIFVVLNCSMARYNGRLHCIVGVLPTCYKRKAATYFYPPGGTGLSKSGFFSFFSFYLFGWGVGGVSNWRSDQKKEHQWFTSFKTNIRSNGKERDIPTPMLYGIQSKVNRSDHLNVDPKQ